MLNLISQPRSERETLNYLLPKDITVSLVSAGSIAYVELEKMSSKSDVDSNKKQLIALANQLGLKLINSETEFEYLCQRLSESVDWTFHGTNEEYTKLKEVLHLYLSSLN